MDSDAAGFVYAVVGGSAFLFAIAFLFASEKRSKRRAALVAAGAVAALLTLGFAQLLLPPLVNLLLTTGATVLFVRDGDEAVKSLTVTRSRVEHVILCLLPRGARGPLT